MANIGEKLRECAQLLGLSDMEVARRVGLSQSRYANYGLNKREPDFATFAKICRILPPTWPRDWLICRVLSVTATNAASRTIGSRSLDDIQPTAEILLTKEST